MPNGTCEPRTSFKLVDWWTKEESITILVVRHHVSHFQYNEIMKGSGGDQPLLTPRDHKTGHLTTVSQKWMRLYTKNPTRKLQSKTHNI
jgi:hypothetical protein